MCFLRWGFWQGLPFVCVPGDANGLSKSSSCFSLSLSDITRRYTSRIPKLPHPHGPSFQLDCIVFVKRLSTLHTDPSSCIPSSMHLCLPRKSLFTQLPYHLSAHRAIRVSYGRSLRGQLITQSILCFSVGCRCRRRPRPSPVPPLLGLPTAVHKVPKVHLRC
ncbi:hypothetical protein F5Y15DRAFT_167072 [Xylariaceae sp. FL0016]|nr:hypothetical protein F5Y15DRAFT_167072 [Xylariaceae sp. FL0016]